MTEIRGLKAARLAAAQYLKAQGYAQEAHLVTEGQGDDFREVGIALALWNIMPPLPRRPHSGLVAGLSERNARGPLRSPRCRPRVGRSRQSCEDPFATDGLHYWPIAVGLLLAQCSLKRTGKEAETLEAPAGSSIRDRPSIPAVEPAAIR